MSDKQNKFLRTVRNSAIIRNPVLFEAVGIAPVVAMAISLKSAIILSVVSAVELVIVEMFACLLLKKLKKSIRMPIYAILGMAINIPLYMFFKSIIPNETANAGIFLPLLAVNSLIALHCERFAVKHKASETFTDSISAAASYAFVIIIIGVIREFLGNGSFYGIKLNLPIELSGLLMPFGGFLLLGFLAAVLKSIINKKYPDANPEASFNLSEISQSHIVKIKNILSDELIPDGEADGETEVLIKTKKAQKEKTKKVKEPSKPEKSKNTKKQKSPKKAVAHVKNTPTDTKAAGAARAEKDSSQSLYDSGDNYLKDFEEMLADLEEYKNKNGVESEKKDDDGIDENIKGGDNK